MKKLISILLILINTLSFSQKYVELFSPNDVYYQGGHKGLFKDMVAAAKTNNLQMCPFKESYSPSVLIELDATIKLVKDFDTINIAKNKCAFDFSKKVLPYLNKWKTLKVKGVSYAAIAKFPVNPFYIVNSKLNPELNKNTPPIFSKGMDYFRLQVADIFSRELKKNRDLKYVVSFFVNENGEMSDLEIAIYPYEKIKNEDYLRAKVLRIRGKWTPGKYNDANIKYRMNLPLTQEFNMRWENQIQEEKFRSLQNK